jgi:hypothetical protein
LQGYKRDHGNSRRVLSLSEDQEFKILVAWGPEFRVTLDFKWVYKIQIKKLCLNFECFPIRTEYLQLLRCREPVGTTGWLRSLMLALISWLFVFGSVGFTLQLPWCFSTHRNNILIIFNMLITW